MSTSINAILGIDHIQWRIVSSSSSSLLRQCYYECNLFARAFLMISRLVLDKCLREFYGKYWRITCSVKVVSNIILLILSLQSLSFEGVLAKCLQTAICLFSQEGKPCVEDKLFSDFLIKDEIISVEKRPNAHKHDH